MSGMERAPKGVDPRQPSSARVYDYLLGGKDNYKVDRVMAHRMLSVAPDTRTLAWFSRKFLVKAVQLACDAGIRQFIDLGAGIPTSPSVHEVAQQTDPSARVVYVDYDPIVYAHCNALLAGSPGVTALQGDVRNPDGILDQLKAGSLIDFSEPVAILLVGVMHFVMDHERPDEIVAAFRDRMAPGSYLAITHGSTDSDPDVMKQMSTDAENTPAQVAFRSPTHIASFFGGLQLVDPGVVPVQQWLEDDLPATRLVITGGIGRNGSTFPPT